MRFSFLAVLLVIGSATAGMAQDQGEGTLLPEIDPQDIEIRSQFQARFPGLMRQPILGFDPTPRLFRIDPDRMPFMEDRDQVVAGLSMSDISRPDPPAYMPLHYSGDINAFARAGFGSYASPEAQFWGVYRTGDTGYLGGDLDYSSGGGHLDNMPSAYRNLKVNAEYGSKLDERTRLDIYGGVRSDFNYSPYFVEVDPDQEIGRIERDGFNAGTSIRRMQNGLNGWDAELNFRSLTSERDLNVDDPTASEWVYDASAGWQWAGPNISEIFRLEGGVRGGWYNFNGGDMTNWNTFDARVAYDRLFNYITKVEAEGGAWYVSETDDSRFYPALHLTVRHWIRDRLTLEYNGDANVQFHTMEELSDRNRFLRPVQELNHTYRIHNNIEANYTFFEESTIFGGFDYQHFLDRPVFSVVGPGSDPSLPDPDPPVYAAQFRDISNLRMYAGTAHQLLPERLWFSGNAYVQIPKVGDTPPQLPGIGETHDYVPFMERWGANGTISFRPIDRIGLEARADLIGPRHVRSNSDETLDTVFLLGAQADVQITDRIGAYARLDNLLSQEYQIWNGYRERPLQVYGGITLKL